ncbi:DUF1552 domain-containing protein [Pseudoalteromonas rubra]|uniref:Uncharacterized protein n=1 Tax=Pseudoalteromonas rubra TaxID=43658 RepID=A0A5S3X5H2_9GAMM|nr:DUF1552 domain-containing protein [Pseudoalteromonas rubra]TMP39875.1 hypothetical protein CWB98_01000 [Pseudoalteromonas rubra]
MKKEHLNNMAISRRSLLKMFMASGISTALIRTSPLVSGLLYARHADAMDAGLPNKTVSIYIPGGSIASLWNPTGSGETMQLGVMSAGYEPVKTECNFMVNMAHSNAGHGRMPVLLAQSWGGDSYDVTMGNALGPNLPFRYLNLGVHSNGQGHLTKDNRNRLPFQENPFTVYKMVFGGAQGSNSKTPIMNAHMSAANAIKNRLAGYEIQRMNDHLDAIADTQRRLDELSGGTSCGIAPDDTEFPLTFDTFSQQARLQADIAVAALQCNLTSSVSLAFGNHQSEFRIPELNFQGHYHNAIHGGSNGQPNYPYYTEMRSHLGSLSAYLIQKLKAAGILDSTVVLETTDMGHADKHSANPCAYLIAGGGARIIRGVVSDIGSGYNQHDVLHTAAKACGVDLGFGKEIPGVIV